MDQIREANTNHQVVEAASDLEARAETFRTDARALGKKSRVYVDELWKDVSALAREGFGLARAYAVELSGKVTGGLGGRSAGEDQPSDAQPGEAAPAGVEGAGVASAPGRAEPPMEARAAGAEKGGQTPAPAQGDGHPQPMT